MNHDTRGPGYAQGGRGMDGFDDVFGSMNVGGGSRHGGGGMGDMYGGGRVPQTQDPFFDSMDNPSSRYGHIQGRDN